jgi:putative transcriptional regulator
MRNRVRALRGQQGLSQEELAEAVGVSRQTINSIEQQRSTPSVAVAIGISRTLGKTVEEVFDAGGRR